MRSSHYKYSAVRVDGETDKIVFELDRMHKNARLTIGGMRFKDAFNDCEPYDRKSHIFYVPHSLCKDRTLMMLTVYAMGPGKFTSKAIFRFDASRYREEKDLYDECDSRLTVKEEENTELCDGVSYIHRLCSNKNGAPVHVYTLIADMNGAALYAGTPDDGYDSRRVKATIPEMINSAEAGGREVIASINGDFFDIFGDMHPSGLLVKNGYLIANADSERPFIGMKKDGTAVVTDLKENPGVIGQLECAVAGLQRIVKDGKVHDWAMLESFGYTPHPRSAAGVTEDGRAVLTVVDGRIPEHSNGATLVDLAGIMLSFGCTDAVNLDGGGSSAVYIKEGSVFNLKSVPADLFRPNDRLIRKEADCVMVIKR